MKKMILLAIVTILAVPAMAFAQNMHVLAGLQGAPPSNVADVPAPFDVFVMLDAGTSDASAAEFVVSELRVLVPGVFQIGEVKINNTPLDVGNNDVGEYVMSFSGCFGPGLLELVKKSYFGTIPADTVLELRGLQDGDSQPSTFDGELGFIDCANVGFAVSMGGTDGGVTGAGVEFPDGSCVLNPTQDVVDNEAGSVSALKGRF